MRAQHLASLPLVWVKLGCAHVSMERKPARLVILLPLCALSTAATMRGSVTSGS